MATAAPDLTGPDYARLIEPGRVHGSLYTDPRVFADELTRIWYRTWVYVGHESEIAEPGDYVRKTLGLQDVIMTRGADGAVRLLLNRCAHRANLVCEAERGHAKSFRCPYHGWTYRNTGELIGFPFNQGYGGKGTIEAELSLASVPRTGSHQGFVFGSMAVDGPSLAEHLGEAAGELDRLARLSPEDTVELTAGWLKHRTRANWKLLAENETDGYHPQFVHGSIFSVTQSPIGDLYSDKSIAVTRNLGHGPQQERPAARVPPDRRAHAVVRHHAGAGTRVRGPDARGLRRGRRADPDRGRPARHGVPQPVRGRDPGLRHPAAA
jgi:fatty-acyl-CoA synthase